MTYNMCIMGLWAYAEISIGIIVSCLPVLPKFFTHVGPKIYVSLSLGNLSGIVLRPKVTSIGKTNKTATSSGVRRAFTEPKSKGGMTETWNDSDHSSELNGQYIALDDYDMQAPKSAAMKRLTQTLADGPATRREDLESGKGGV